MISKISCSWELNIFYYENRHSHSYIRNIIVTCIVDLKKSVIYYKIWAISETNLLQHYESIENIKCTHFCFKNEINKTFINIQ